MRYPGDNAAGRSPGRRHSPSGRTGPPEEAATAADGNAPRGDAWLFTPGYSGDGGQAQDHGRFPAGGGRYGPSGAAGKGPIRGFPPAPGQPPPLYPPGQFSAWNRTPGPGGNGYDSSASDTWLAGDYAGPAGDGYPEPGLDDHGYGEPEPGYAALAVSEPAADVTSTQAWEAVDSDPAASHWPDLDTTVEPWPDAAQDDTPPGAVLAAGLAGPGLAGPELAGPELAGPGLGGAGWAEPELAGPGDGHPDGWDEPPWPDMGAAAPFGRAGDTDPGPADHADSGPGQRTATGPGQRAATGPGQRTATGPGQRGGARPGPRTAGPGADPGRGPRGPGHGTRGRARPRGRKRRVRALMACALVLAVVAGGIYFWFSRAHKSPSTAAASQQTAASARPSPTDPSPSPSPSPSLGTWGHIGSRALDPVPLTLGELFPAQFTSAGTGYTRTVQKAKTHCATALMGSQLVTAVGQAGCTQAMRASYLSADHKLMGTIGVLNLLTAAAAEKAGKASGPSNFIAQLPAANGPTRNLTKGNGFEAAEVKGHYLVLVWAEFADLRVARTAAQKAELKAFITLLFQQTANVSLASREVTGQPAT
jgi:hypothetical protein